MSGFLADQPVAEFGPIIPLLKWKDEQEVVARASKLHIRSIDDVFMLTIDECANVIATFLLQTIPSTA